jgi:hypothetical protein
MDWSFLLSSFATLLVGALVPDLAVGDPRWRPHPVVLMGKVTSPGELWLRSGLRLGYLLGRARRVEQFAHYQEPWWVNRPRLKRGGRLSRGCSLCDENRALARKRTNLSVTEAGGA